ncbi:MAG: ergothioneine biosynthesis protein EgtB [alpha proteobacterium HIMB114]|nr:MAG: ergothioneine biosynthesis protein EgtB [alpha proteobacterium HIMB114]
MENNEIKNLFKRTRQKSLNLVKNLKPEDTCIQSMEDASPLKWHLAHTSWFFEEFVIKKVKSDFKSPDPRFNYLFNSYYVQAGPRFTRSQRGLISKPDLNDVLKYRKLVDEILVELIEDQNTPLEIVELGCHHEMQHQELMLTDILHAFSFNPLRPKYINKKIPFNEKINHYWYDCEGGIHHVGNQGHEFCYDCEQPRHEVLVHPFKISNQLITNGEWKEFIDSNGYENPNFWLMDGFAVCEKEQWKAPLYWWKDANEWYQFTLCGIQKVDDLAPVHHISFYEADAFARWKGRRLPTEFEWETLSNEFKEENFLDDENYLPYSKNNDQNLKQIWGHVWEWTSSSFSPYPGFSTKNGALGEYNGKFMINQMVLKGGSCFSPKKQIRRTYRNFFYPHQRWQMAGLRLAA